MDGSDNADLTPDERVATARMRRVKAQWAYDGLHHYVSYDPGDIETTLVDFMADALHLAELNGIDFDLVLDRARGHYLAEGGAGVDPDAAAVVAAVSDSA